MYVSKFAGGKDAPIITFLSKFGSLVEWHIFLAFLHKVATMLVF